MAVYRLGSDTASFPKSGTIYLIAGAMIDLRCGLALLKLEYTMDLLSTHHMNG
jgi:hypothetical protein